MHARVGGLAEELGRRVDEIAGRAEGLLGRDEAAAAAAAQAAWVQRELDVLREWADARAAAVDAVLAAADEARLTGQLELGGRLDEAVATIQAELDEVAARPLQDRFLEARVDGLSERLAGLAAVEGAVADLRRSFEEMEGRERAGADRISGLGEELHARVGGLAEELGRRVDEVAGRAEGLLGRDEAAAAASAQAAWVQRELDVLREWSDTRAAAVDVALAAADEARLTGQLELGGRLDEAIETIQAELVRQSTELGTGVEANAGETAALHARVDALQEAAAGVPRGRRVSSAGSSSASTSWRSDSPGTWPELEQTPSMLGAPCDMRQVRFRLGSTSSTVCVMRT